MRRFFVSRQKGIFWPLEVSAFSYFVIIFQFVMVSMKIFEIHSLLILSRRAPDIFLKNFSFISIPKNEAQAIKKRGLRIFQFEKHPI